MALTFAKLTRAIPATVHPAATAHFKTAASRPFPRLNHIHFHTVSKIMGSQGASTYRANGDNGDEGNTEGELNQWKHRAPYKVHDNDPNFHARYTGSCHCGKVTYQLSREKPLDSKYCHCTTCQKIHGTLLPYPSSPCSKTHTNAAVQEHPSSGPPSSTKKISISPMEFTTSAGTRVPRKLPCINCPAKLAAHIAVHPSWMKGGT